MKNNVSHDWHHLPASEVGQLLGVDPSKGLPSDQVRQRFCEYGPNELTARRGMSPFMRFLMQFNQALVYILVLASVVTVALGEYVDAAVIFGVVLVNAIIGYIQESKAEKAIDALSKMVLTEATVLRNGRKERVPSRELVPGDVVFLQSGDKVPSDLRLLQVRNLQVDESSLTGESVPVSKHVNAVARDTLLADRKNIAYAATLVTSGQGSGLVWATGDSTETGRIARLIHGAAELSTPLTRKIAEFSRLLLWIILALAAATFVVGVSRGENPAEMFMAAIALAVGAIPEGLPAAVTITLAIGVSPTPHSCTSSSIRHPFPLKPGGASLEWRPSPGWRLNSRNGCAAWPARDVHPSIQQPRQTYDPRSPVRHQAIRPRLLQPRGRERSHSMAFS